MSTPNNRPMSKEEMKQLAEEAAHAAFAVLCNRIDPDQKRDMGAEFDFAAEWQFLIVQNALVKAMENVEDIQTYSHMKNVRNPEQI